MTGSDERDRATGAQRIAVVAVASVLGGLIAGVGVIGSEAIEARLTEAANGALRDAGISGVEVRFDGREGFLSSPGATAGELAEAGRVVEAIDGVRWVSIVDDALPDPGTTPELDVQDSADGGVVVTAVVGTQEQAQALQEAATEVFGADAQVDIEVVDGVAVADWVADAADLFAALEPVEGLAFHLEDGAATLAGSAPDPLAVETGVEAALDGMELASALTASGPSADDARSIEGTVIRFGADGVALGAEARERIAELAEAMERYPSLRLRLVGHIAIPTGSEADAIAFSQRRAQVVADALVAAGVQESRLEVVGAGASEPVADNSTESGAAKNRRVTVVIIEEG